MSAFRRKIFVKEPCPDRVQTNVGPEVLHFHKSLPEYRPSPLIALPDLAKELGVSKVLIKDESSRFSLPSFKILGASWGACRAIIEKLRLPTNSTLNDLRSGLSQTPLTLVAATDGNHGRAVAFIASLLGISAVILVPAGLDQHVKDAISNEGAKVIEIDGDYDTTVQQAARMADGHHLLIQDTAWEGYEEIPRWIVEGYSTIFSEIEDHVWSEDTIVVTPVGVGSLAHGVVQACKSRNAAVKVVSVEPDTAACLYKNRNMTELTPIKTSFTIMTGMDCGTVSHTVYGDLQKHIDISLTVSDFESHQAVQYLAGMDVSSGPCGAAGVAAARRLHATGNLKPKTTLIMINTESTRQYRSPYDVSTDNPVELTQILTQIESTNVTLSRTPGSGEKQIADYIEAWLQHRHVETHRIGTSRPSIVGVVRGAGGKSLMLNGHIDTVSLDGYTADPLGGKRETRSGKDVITGRATLDMKAGVAIAMCNLAKAKAKGLKGDIILCAVADEEDASRGTEAVLAAGWRADAAIIPEPTQTQVFIAHKGFLWVEVTILGNAAHGSDPNAGVDAIMQSRLVLDALHKYASGLPTHPDVRQATMHCGTIRGGEENSSYPAECVLTREFRTVPGQSSQKICEDISAILSDLSDIRTKEPVLLFERPAYQLEDRQLLHTFLDVAKSHGQNLRPGGGAFWCDAALLGGEGIPTLVFGPSGDGLHGKDEFVYVESILQADRIIEDTITRFCG